MRNLFYFLPVLTTRACVNKYGVPQIGGNYRSGSRSNVLQCRQTDQELTTHLIPISFHWETDQLKKRASLLHLFLPKQFEMSLQIQIAALLLREKQIKMAHSMQGYGPLLLPTNRSMSPSSAYFTSNIAD